MLDIKVNMVAWIKKAKQQIKVNPYGSALSNQGRLGAGGILIDNHGKMVMAFATPMGEGTKNKAEFEAAILGLNRAIEHRYRNIIQEIGSQQVGHLILKKATPQWNISTQLGRIQNLISKIQNMKCVHVCREANCVADTLSKFSHKINNPQIYFNSQQMPKQAKSYYHFYLLQMSKFRRKKIKRMKEPP